MSREYRDAIHVLRLEIVKTNPETAFDELHEISRACQRMSNQTWRMWESWHRNAGTPQKIREYLDSPKPDKGKKPLLGIKAVPKEIKLYLECARANPHVSVDVVATITNQIAKRIAKGKAANSRLPKWWSILLDYERSPSFARPMSILFPPKSCKFIPPSATDDKDGCRDWRLELKVGRSEVIGKNGKPKGVNRVCTAVIQSRTNKASRQAALLARIKPGKECGPNDWKFCGS